MGIKKLKECFGKLGIKCAYASKAFEEMNAAMKTANEIAAIESEMAKLSSWDFVSAFRYPAKAMTEMLQEPNAESYKRFANEAIKMLARGDDPAEVLWHFDLRLEKMKKGGEA